MMKIFCLNHEDKASGNTKFYGICGAAFIIMVISLTVMLLKGRATGAAVYSSLNRGDKLFIMPFKYMINIDTNTDGNVIEISDFFSEAQISSDGVDPELKAFLDSYEKFMDKYVDFMKQYLSGSMNMTDMIGGYAKILAEYKEFQEKVDAYVTNNMSETDAAYYLEVTARCIQKALEIYQ